MSVGLGTSSGTRDHPPVVWTPESAFPQLRPPSRRLRFEAEHPFLWAAALPVVYAALWFATGHQPLLPYLAMSMFWPTFSLWRWRPGGRARLAYEARLAGLEGFRPPGGG